MRRITLYVIVVLGFVAFAANELLSPYGDARLIVVALAFVGIIAALMLEWRHQRRTR